MPCSTCTTPLPCSKAKANWARIKASCSGVMCTLATGSSMVCSLKRSILGNPVVGKNSPSTRKWVKPRGRAQSASSVYTPLRFMTNGANKPMCCPLNWRYSCATMLSGVCGATAAPSCTQCCTPSFTNSKRKKCQTSVVVPTVLMRPPRERRCSIATVGGMPYTASTSGRPAGCTMERAYALSDSR